MLARTSKLTFRGCRELSTPLFIPSFSSRGFESDTGYSEILELYRFASSHLSDVSLISAFDIRQKRLSWNDVNSIHSEVLFIDSGGYEAAGDVSSEWSKETHSEVLADRPLTVPAIFVSYDSPFADESMEIQIERANEFKQVHPQADVDLLLRAECRAKSLDIGSIRKVVSTLSPFAIIGVTEKDLGASVKERMIAIRALRRLLDDAQLSCPIHIFGSLSPVTSILYFLMGAEIFDGLSWLRYYFVDHRAHHMIESYETAEDIGLTTFDLRKRRMISNLNFLESLTLRAAEFSSSGDWSLLPQGNLCREIVLAVEGEL